jgi:hypothetical protein
VRQKRDMLCFEKKGCDFSSAGHYCGSDHAVFPVATIKNKECNVTSHLQS